ncbi:MAG: homocysteine S-methyltransferase family protein [Pseudomonadota bacterium]
MNSDFLKTLKERILVFDGAMGTMLDAKGARAECNEELCLSKPDVISDIHRAYLDAGADIITTNTFGASRVVLAEHGLANSVQEINFAAAKLARKQAEAASGAHFVAGELGPTSKLPTLLNIGFDELEAAYAEQIGPLMDGGVHIIIIQTCQDPLQVKAAASACKRVFNNKKTHLPIIVSVTIERVGTMLLGTEILAALATIAPYKPIAFGINCATGPKDMEEHLATLADSSPFPIVCQPNAGMPENVGGKSVYNLSPKEFAKMLCEFIRSYGISMVGGCCGTTPDHIAALATELRRETLRLRPAPDGAGLRSGQARERYSDTVSSLYTAVSLDQEPKPFLIAEQTNVNGSKKFRELLLASDYDAMADVGKDAARASHALDLCVAYAGRDEKADLVEMVKRLALKSDVPLMIDSTNPDALEAALALIPARPIINSINLEDGGVKAKRILGIAKRFGAAVVALTIDESGMAKTVKRKLAIAKRLVDMANEEGFEVGDLLIDPLTFTLASGDAELKSAGRETLDAIANIKKSISGVRVLLGVSNISFGLPPKGRKLVTSVFLQRAIKSGLDAAIINPAKIVPLDQIPKEARILCERLIGGDDSKGDPLLEFIKYIETSDVSFKEHAAKCAPKTPEEALRLKVKDGSKEGLDALIKELLERTPPKEIINSVLLPAMQEVGVSFGKGALALPFVLQAAETMRASIDLLTPYMKGEEVVNRATIVLATVRGDVHDIGKNLVDAILSNNGFRVINLGIRQPASAILEAVKAHNADAIGLSGLLVSSTEIMREDLQVFQEAGLNIPVLCGGAALTKSFVKDTLAKAYEGKVCYCVDAFSGLTEMENIAQERCHHIDKKHITPPFFGAVVLDDIPLDDVEALLDKKALFLSRWQFRKGADSKALPIYERMMVMCRAQHIITPKIVYGYFKCEKKNNGLIAYSDQGKPFRFDFPRERTMPHRCVADFFDLGFVAIQLATVGDGVNAAATKKFKNHEYSDAFFLKGLAASFAEATTQYGHDLIRKELGIAPDVGERFSPGYPAFPDLSAQKKIAQLLKPTRIGVSLTKTYQLIPEHSTSAVVSIDEKAVRFRP